jgi:hypothetical protein
MELIKTGEVKRHAITSSAGALVAYARAIGLQTRDEQTITIQAPDGKAFAEYRSPPLVGARAQFFVSTGRKLRGQGARANIPQKRNRKEPHLL